MTFTSPARTGIARDEDGVRLLDGPLGALLLAGSADTDGGAAFVIHDLAPRGLGSPVHTHRREDEWSYVLTGEVGVLIGATTAVARPGDLVLKPRGVPHAFWNAGDVPARFLEIITPGGFEGYFAELGELFAGEGAPDFSHLQKIATRYELDIDPSSVPALAQEHGLVLP